MRRPWRGLKWLIALVPLAVGCALAVRPEAPATSDLTTAGVLEKQPGVVAMATPEGAGPTATAEDAPEIAEIAKVAQPAGALLPGVIAGVVRNADGPVTHARVRVRLTDYLTLSAEDGSFRLTALPFTEPVSVTAWADGYYVGYSNGWAGDVPITITLTPYYITDNLDYDWFEYNGMVGSASCAPCHPSYEEWAADAHGQAAQNPRFITMYEGTDVRGNRSPQTTFDEKGYVPLDPSQLYYGVGVKTDYPDRAWNCAACHTPLGAKLASDTTCGWSGCHAEFTASVSDALPQAVEATGFQDPNALDGVGCDFCHKVGDVYLDPKTKLPYADRPGILSMRLYRPEEGQQLFFGTFDDVTRRVSYLPLLEESAFCAPCHYGVFGGVVAPGEVVGGVVVYNSYGEWLDSPYSDPETGQTCQDCHMPTVDYDYFVFPEEGGLRRDPNDVHDHRMPGASDVEFLQDAVTMTTTVTTEAGRLAVEVAIANDNTGHHVPTGTPMRHLILVVTAHTEDGEVLPLLAGSTLPEWTGNYAGMPGEAYAKILYDEWSGEVPTAAYWRPVHLVSDNRIAAYETARTHYAFDLPDDGTVIISARLFFRRAFQGLAELKGWDDPDILMEEASVTLAH
ncbi:MAG: hypothetical protein MUQ30_14525 [Anaerolineae bacterium]|nr:hypothetical protein [Anaerolineae bacterium]